MSENKDNIYKIIGIIIFITGFILCGIFLYSILWGTIIYSPIYWWYLIIGAPFLAVGTIIVNKTIKG
ncbi:MAG: hypothetical protein ACTSPY_01450 [Candidatus Helarchaeota archaeon]